MSKNELIENYRKAFATVRTFPFLYTLMLLILSPFDAWLALDWAQVLWLLSFTSVPSAWLCWKLSQPLNLCGWYRCQCLVILTPLAIPIVRIFHPTIEIAYVWLRVMAIGVISLVNCYMVIIRPTAANRTMRRLTANNNIQDSDKPNP